MNWFKKYSGYIGFGLLLSGMILGAIGWIKNESTITADTKGAVFMIILGVTMIIGGLVTLKLNSSKTNK
jgi:sulfite exporter TauE/SafE